MQKTVSCHYKKSPSSGKKSNKMYVFVIKGPSWWEKSHLIASFHYKKLPSSKK